MENKSPELEVAIKAALEGGKILEKYFETEILRETKHDKSVVTIADKESEDVIKKIILGAFPEHSIMGEETGLTQNASDYIWHIDPLDATRNFVSGIPFFAVSLALVRGHEVIVAVVYNPATDSLFYAEKGKGAYYNYQGGDKKIFVSKDDEKIGIFTVTSGRVEEDLEVRRKLRHNLNKAIGAHTRDFGCTALDLAYIARGNLAVSVQLGLATYDFAAGVLLVTEAGGKITKPDGTSWQFPGNYFIASNGVFDHLIIDEIKKIKGGK